MSISDKMFKDTVAMAKIKKIIDATYPDSLTSTQKEAIEDTFISFLVRSFMIEEWSEQELNSADDVYNCKSISLEDIRHRVYETITDYLESHLEFGEDNNPRLDERELKEVV
jgi:hypothetical protein